MKPPFTSNKILNPSGDYAVTKDITQFNRDCCLKQEKIAFDHGKGVNIYIVYEINDYRNIGSYPTPENCLFVAAKLTKHY